MKIAISQKGILTLAPNAIRGQRYWCPDCGQLVRICRGKAKQAYFAHQNNRQHGQGETNEHQVGKAQMLKWAQSRGWQVDLEHYYPQIKQRADLLLKRSNLQVVIEFQCSNLGLKRLVERNRGYAQIGIKPIWILGSPYRHRLQAKRQAQFTYLDQQKPTIYFWDYQEARLIKMRGWIFPKPKVNLHQVSRDVYGCQFNFGKNQALRQITAQTYQAGHDLSTCPLVAHCRETNWPLLTEPLFYWHLRQLLLLEQFRLGRVWQLQEWLRWVNFNSSWLPLPCLTNQQRQLVHQQLIWAWTRQLLSAKILKLDQRRLIYWHLPNWFSNYEAKLRAMKRIK
ncbi:MAG TPA: competence protein CoiA [Candidatus Limosilactobacillus faecipullorum]|nr:competence protein CoiA [Candidatus Limosilactobacillus faecipullorum]